MFTFIKKLTKREQCTFEEISSHLAEVLNLWGDMVALWWGRRELQPELQSHVTKNSALPYTTEILEEDPLLTH